MKIPEELLKKKRWLINTFKRKTGMAKSNHKTVVITIVNSSGKKGLPISIFETKVLIPSTKEVDIPMIDADAYQIICKLKRV